MSKETISQNIERETPPQEFVGVQTRFLLASEPALNPKATLQSEAVRTIVPFAERDYRPFEKASIRELKAIKSHHVRIGNTPESTMRSIAHSNLVKLEQKTSDEWDNFYKRYFKTLDVDVDQPTELTVDDVLKAQDRYFAPDKPHKDRVKEMVSDIMLAYETNGELDADAIKDNIRNIKNWAAMLGPESSDMVVQLVLAETKLRTDRQFHDKAAENINNLTEPEVKLLEFVSARKENTVPQEDDDDEIMGNELPILRKKEEIQESVKNKKTTLIIGGTGSGKTVGVPPMVRELLMEQIANGEHGKIIVTQPTKLNTSDIAEGIAEREGLTLGKEIGYEYSGKKKTSPENDTLFRTERLLVLDLLKDPLLPGVSHVMVDEVHVQSVHTEELLALLKLSQGLREANGLPPLKIIAASATANKEKLEKYLDTKTIEVKGKTFGYDIDWAKKNYDEKQLPEETAKIIKNLEEEKQEGDAVIFVAGQADMLSTMNAIKDLDLENVELIPLHSGSTEEQKKKAKVGATEGIRKVFIATNFAETGVTIKDLKYVINTGYEWDNILDPLTGLDYMKKIKKSQAAIVQSMGRVGRLFRGQVFNLFTKADFDSRPEFSTPEMEKTDLTETLLDMKVLQRNMKEKYNVDFDPATLPFLTELNPRRIEAAEDTLKKLGAVNPDGTLNDIGKRMVELPVGFRAARLVAEAEKQQKGLKEMSIVAAMIEGKPPVGRNEEKQKQVYGKFGVASSDFLTYLNIWNAFDKNGFKKEWAHQNGLDYGALMGAKSTLAKITERTQEKGQGKATYDELAQMITKGYMDRIMKFTPSTKRYHWDRNKVSNYTLVLGNETGVQGTPDIIIAASNSKVEPGVRTVKLSTVQAVKEEWL